MTGILTKQEQIFIKNYIQQFGDSEKKSYLPYYIGYIILSISGVFMIVYSGFLTFDNMTDNVIKWVFLPGVLSGLLLILSGYLMWLSYNRNLDNQKLVSILKKLL